MAGNPEEDVKRLIVRVAISAVFLVVGFWIVFGEYDAALTKAAFGWLGFVLGYWLS